jgi:hypothetical protein
MTKNRYKKYKPLRHIGWIGEGFLIFEYPSYKIYYYFEVRFSDVDLELRKNDSVATLIIDMLEDLVLDQDSITDSPHELTMTSWRKWLSK